MAAFQARARSATRPPPRRCYQPGRRRPFALTISIRPQPDPVPFSGGSETIIAGRNPGGTPSRPARYALRHENKSWLEIPCRRAVAEASRGPDRLSSTMRTFASQPSTAPTRLNNLKKTDGASVSKAIHTDSQLHPAQFGKAAYTG
jgi:hypothetical protein